jgi:hypothetical protein
MWRSAWMRGGKAKGEPPVAARKCSWKEGQSSRD